MGEAEYAAEMAALEAEARGSPLCLCFPGPSLPLFAHFVFFGGGRGEGVLLGLLSLRPGHAGHPHRLRRT